MSVSGPKGFRAYGVASGLKSDGLDLAIVQNLGPRYDATAVFTNNEVKAAPVLWSQEVLKTGACKAVILNSGGANACTGPEGFAVTHQTAEYLAEKLGFGAIDVAVCSTGIIGEQLDFPKIRKGIDRLTDNHLNDGELAARAIMTTDSKPKQDWIRNDKYSIGGMAKGAGMLAPSLATMLVVLTTDADVSSLPIAEILNKSVEKSFNRITSDGSTSTNDTVLFLASGASGYKPDTSSFEENLLTICKSLAKQIISDAEGATVFVEINVSLAKTQEQALMVARKVAQDLLVKTALFGRDPNWGRIAAAAGSANAGINPNILEIDMNGVSVCLNGKANGDRHRVSLHGERIVIDIRLNMGSEEAQILTTDLSTQYVIENSEYSS